MSMLPFTAQQNLVSLYYQSHHAWLRRWLHKKLGCTHDAADITNDTFIKVLQKQDLPALAEPRAYLTTIAHGLMVNHIRRRDMEQALHAALALLQADAAHISPESYLLTLEKLIIIDTMLDGLPPKVREAFLLHKLDGLGYAEIAAHMQLSVSSIKKYIAKALLHCAAAQMPAP